MYSNNFEMSSMRDALGSRGSASSSSGSRPAADSRSRVSDFSSSNSRPDFSYSSNDRSSSQWNNDLSRSNFSRSGTQDDRLGYRSPKPSTIPEEPPDYYGSRAQKSGSDKKFEPRGGEFDKYGYKTPKSTPLYEDDERPSVARMERDLARSRDENDMRKSLLIDKTITSQRRGDDDRSGSEFRSQGIRGFDDRFGQRQDESAAERDRRKQAELDKILKGSASSSQKSELQLQKEALLREQAELSKRMQNVQKPKDSTNDSSMSAIEREKQRLKEQFMKDSAELGKKVQKQTSPKSDPYGFMKDDGFGGAAARKDDKFRDREEDKLDRYGQSRDDRRSDDRYGLTKGDKFASRDDRYGSTKDDKSNSRDDRYSFAKDDKLAAKDDRYGFLKDDKGRTDDRRPSSRDDKGFKDDRYSFKDDKGRTDDKSFKDDRDRTDDRRPSARDDKGFKDDRYGFLKDDKGRTDDRKPSARDDKGFKDDRYNFKDDKGRTDDKSFKDDRYGFLKDDKGRTDDRRPSSRDDKGFKDDRYSFKDDRDRTDDRRPSSRDDKGFKDDRYGFLKDDKGRTDDRKPSARDDKGFKDDRYNFKDDKSRTDSRGLKEDRYGSAIDSKFESRTTPREEKQRRDAEMDMLSRELRTGGTGGSGAKDSGRASVGDKSRDPEKRQLSERELKRWQLKQVVERLADLVVPHVTVCCVPRTEVKTAIEPLSDTGSKSRRLNLIEVAAPRAGLRVKYEHEVQLDQLFSMKNCIVWNDQPNALQNLFEMPESQRTNHFPLVRKVCQKKRFFKDLLALGSMAAYKKDYSFLPGTFRMPNNSGLLRKYLADLGDDKKQRLLVWKALRPDEVDFREKLKIFWNDNLPDKIFDAPGLVQEYVTNPLLVDGARFTLRHFVLISQCYPQLHVHTYIDALAIFCNEAYVLPAAKTKKRIGLLPHMTTLPDTPVTLGDVRHDEHSRTRELARPRSRIKLMSAVLDKLRDGMIRIEEDKKLAERFLADLKDTMYDVLVKCIIPLVPHLANSYRSCRPFTQPGAASVCFELLSFDLLLDSRYRPWFIDFDMVNLTNPSASDSAAGVKSGESVAEPFRTQLAEDTLRFIASAINERNVNGELETRLLNLDSKRDPEVQKLIKPKESKKKAQEKQQNEGKKSEKTEYVELHTKEHERSASAERTSPKVKQQPQPLLTAKEVRELEKQVLQEQADKLKPPPRAKFVQIYPPVLPVEPKKPEAPSDDSDERSPSYESKRQQEAYQKALKQYEAQLAAHNVRKQECMARWDRYSQLLITAFTAYAKAPLSQDELDRLKPPSNDDANKPTEKSEAERMLLQLRKNVNAYCEQLFELHDALMRERVPVPKSLQKSVTEHTEKIRTEWHKHQKDVLTFWLLTLTQAKREKVVQLVEEPIVQLLGRIWRTEDVKKLRLFRILQRVLTKLFSNNGNFLFQCVKDAKGQEALELKDDLKSVYSVATIEYDGIMQQTAELKKISSEDRDQLLSNTVLDTETMILRHFVAFVLDAVITVYSIQHMQQEEKRAQSGKLDEKVTVHGYEKAASQPDRYYCISIVKRA